MSSKIDLKLKYEKKDNWSVHALEFANDKSVIKRVILGELINIQTRNNKKKLPWQQEIAKAIKSECVGGQRNEKSHYAISLGMGFSDSKQKQLVDVDNFIKPIFAGIAAGLFSDEIPSSVEDFKKCDDSNFVYLYVERLDNKPDGVFIVISEKQ